jgi:hypothetical protein
VSDLDRFFHPRRRDAPPESPTKRRWLGTSVAVVVVAVAAALLRRGRSE